MASGISPSSSCGSEAIVTPPIDLNGFASKNTAPFFCSSADQRTAPASASIRMSLACSGSDGWPHSPMRVAMVMVCGCGLPSSVRLTWMVACWQPPSFDIDTYCDPSALLCGPGRLGQCSEPERSSKIDSTWPEISSSSAEASECMAVSAAKTKVAWFIGTPECQRLFDADRAHHLDVGNTE